MFSISSTTCCSSFLSSSEQQEVIRLSVKEGSDVVLPCSLSNTDLEVFLYARGSSYGDGLPGQDDHFKDRVFHFPEQLAVGNASIVIRKTQVTDSGNYTCYFPFHEPQRRAQYELIVGECPHSDGDRQLCISRSDWFNCSLTAVLLYSPNFLFLRSSFLFPQYFLQQYL
uniref:Ig-like domain-containing protein n=1 Tax=Salarias fasciatus TaxID=181472 RepID=A0A672G921_SALFA